MTRFALLILLCTGCDDGSTSCEERLPTSAEVVEPTQRGVGEIEGCAPVTTDTRSVELRLSLDDVPNEIEGTFVLHVFEFDPSMADTRAWCLSSHQFDVDGRFTEFVVRVPADRSDLQHHVTVAVDLLREDDPDDACVDQNAFVSFESSESEVLVPLDIVLY